MEAARDTIGEMQFNSEIGLSGHPGLAADIYSLPITRPGVYRFETTPSQLENYQGVAEIRILRSDVISFDEDHSSRRNGISIETHGGVVVSERTHLSNLRGYFDRADFDPGSDAEALWNRFADGYSSSHIEQFDVPGASTLQEFGFFPCDEYLATTPLLYDDEVCGHLIQCRCDPKGNILPAPVRLTNSG